MLRVDNSMEIVITRWSLGGLFTGRYAAKAGDRTHRVRWKREALRAVLAEQRETPVLLVRDGRRALWLFHGSFYWEDDDVDRDDVRTLVLQREQMLREPRTARGPAIAEELARLTPTAVRALAPVGGFERVSGRCVDCGSHFWPWASDERRCNRCAQSAVAA